MQPTNQAKPRCLNGRIASQVNVLEKESHVSLTVNHWAVNHWTANHWAESLNHGKQRSRSGTWLVSVPGPVSSPGQLSFKRFAAVCAAVLLMSVGLPPLCDCSVAGEVDKKSIREKAETTGNIEKPKTTTLSLRGRVVWMAEALERRFGIQTVPEAAEQMLALETAGGELYPIVEDVRGRSFRKDRRLRKLDVELLVRRYEGSPMIRVIRIYAWKEEGKFELDYWCDICAISMYETGPCDCCQESNRLRQRQVESP